jgi:hypothetical protein
MQVVVREEVPLFHWAVKKHGLALLGSSNPILIQVH